MAPGAPKEALHRLSYPTWAALMKAETVCVYKSRYLYGGAGRRDLQSRPAPAQSFAEAAAAGVAPGRQKRLRVAFTPDLGGIAPVEAETAALCRAAAERFSAMGAAVVEACPDLRDAAQVFQVHKSPRNQCMVCCLQPTELRTSVAHACMWMIL